MERIKFVLLVAILISALLVVVSGHRSEVQSETGSTNLNSNVPSTTELGANNSQDKSQPIIGSGDKNLNKRKLEIKLPNGGNHVLQLRARTRLPIPLSLGDEIDDLKAKANAGDGDASFTLYFSLSECETAPKTELEKKEALERLYTSGEVNYSTVKNGITIERTEYVPLDGSLKNSEELFINRPYRFCAGVSDEEIKLKENWLTKGAEQSNVNALREIANRRPFNNQTAQYLERAWQEGDLKALEHLTALYMNGWGEVPMINTDPIAAYANLLAYSSVIEAGYFDLNSNLEEQPQNVAARYYLELTNIARDMENGLHPHQIEQGKIIANKILLENGECCFGL